MRVTFDIFTCNRVIKLKMASKRSELNLTNPKQIHLGLQFWWLQFAEVIEMSVPQAETFHMTCTVLSYEVTLEKRICVSRTIVSTVPPCAKN